MSSTGETAVCAWPVGAALGEGPIWNEADQAVWFVDIKGGSVHRYDPATSDKRSFAFDGAPSFIVPTTQGTFCVGSRDRLVEFTAAGVGAEIARAPILPTDRTNDATVDAQGRLWFGTMDDEETEETGAVHLYDGASVRRVGGKCCITNGPAISPCGRFLYHVDTLGRTIWRFDISQGTELKDGELFVALEPGAGNPDGVTIDSEGCLWVALWGGWSLRRYDPSGALVGTVKVPCANVTKVAFGGPGLSLGFITTARVGLSQQAAAEQTEAGGLFVFDAPAPGLKLPVMRLAGPGDRI